MRAKYKSRFLLLFLLLGLVFSALGVGTALAYQVRVGEGAIYEWSVWLDQDLQEGHYTGRFQGPVREVYIFENFPALRDVKLSRCTTQGN